MIGVNDYAFALPREIKLHGGHSDNDNPVSLKAGNLSMILENGSLRYIRSGKDEIIRMIYFALRDRDWLTIKPDISYTRTEINKDSFDIRFNCKYRRNDISFSAEFSIEGKKDSSIIIKAEGEAESRFMRNRIGFCVLHPLRETAGKSCSVTHTDGTAEDLRFPGLISPHQPFLDIRSFTWSAGGSQCRLDFSGDVFETEDQRNWTDSSFKTYSTPLSMPFPVLVEKGTKINQSILLKMEGEITEETNPDEPVKITLFPDARFNIPPVGFSRSSSNIKLSPSETTILKKAGFDNYRVELHLSEQSWKRFAAEAAGEANSLNCKIEFVLLLDDDFRKQIRSFLEWTETRVVSISTILLLHRTHPVTPDELAREVIPLIRKSDSGIKIGTGTNANFVQLNRNRPTDHDSDSICYSIHPQEHASDNSTLVENLEAQAHTIGSVKSFSPGKKIIVSPVTIQRRFNANKVYHETPSEGNQMPPQVDTRIMSLFGAGWTAGSLKNLVTAGVESITYFETTGERGIIQGDQPSRWPDGFRSVKGMIFPVYHLLRFVLGAKSFHIIKSDSSAPLRAESIVMSDGKSLKIVLANFTGVVQPVVAEILKGQFRVKEMNEYNFHELVSDSEWLEDSWEVRKFDEKTVALNPFSLTFISNEHLIP